MSLPVSPAELSSDYGNLVVREDRRRPASHAPPDRPRFEQPPDEPRFDAAAPVSVDPDTGAALADLHAVDAVPLSVAIGHYREDG